MAICQTMKKVRDHFQLGSKRWSTLAKLPQYQKLLAPGEGGDHLRKALTDLYKLRNDAAATTRHRRQLVARAKEAHAAANAAAETKRRQDAASKRAAAAERRRRLRSPRSDSCANRQGDVTKTFTWDLDPPIFSFEEGLKGFRIVSELRARLHHLRAIMPGNRRRCWRLMVGRDAAFYEGEVVSTRLFNNPSDALADVANKLGEMASRLRSVPASVSKWKGEGTGKSKPP